MELKILDLFSSIGGMNFAFKCKFRKRNKNYYYIDSKLNGHVMAAMDFKTVANKVYPFNHHETYLRYNNNPNFPHKSVYPIPGIANIVLNRRVWLMDIVTNTASNTMCFSKAYSYYVKETVSIYFPLSLDKMQSIFFRLKEIEKMKNHGIEE
ncbi:hypothetical protein CVS40_5321 [Lucilia cuprina]|nr:hypothetical protein CVS40_5321 [Lucilia cuprina]